MLCMVRKLELQTSEPRKLELFFLIGLCILACGQFTRLVQVTLLKYIMDATCLETIP